MAHHVEPMDVDSSVCDFDDKENSFHHNNLLPRTPCTEKGYEELDVSELNMKLRYSITPAASPMSKSYTANCLDNQNNETDVLDIENGNMSRSLHTTLTKNDTLVKTQKSLPLQALPTDHSQIGDGNRNVLQPLDSTATADNTVTITGPIDVEDNLSLPSSSSSMVHTPEATTPTKEMQKSDGRSPILRGLKSVLSMFRPSQSPIPPDDELHKHEALSPPIVHSPECSDKAQSTCVSTPLTVQKTKDPLGKSNSPTRDILVFNEDLEKELEWKDDSIIFGKEKVPIHKLFFQLPNQSASKTNPDFAKTLNKCEKFSENINQMVEYMDISYNNTELMDKTASNIPDMDATTESDGEFVDAESTIKSELEQSFSDVISFQEHNTLHGAQQENSSVSKETLNASILKSADSSSASTETTKVDETFIEKPTVMEAAFGQPDIVKVEIDSSEIIGKLDFIKSHDIIAPLMDDVLNNYYNNTTVVEPVSANVIIDRTHYDDADVGETTAFENIIQNQNITSEITDTTNVPKFKVDMNNTVSDLTQVPMPVAETNGVDDVNTTETIVQEPIPKEVTVHCKSLLDAKVCEITNVAPPYMTKVEKHMIDEETQNITDEKVVASENNRSFALVSQDQVAPLMNDVLNNDHNNTTVVEPVSADVILDRSPNNEADVGETTEFGDIIQNQNITSDINSTDTTKVPEVKVDVNNTVFNLTQVHMAAVDTNEVDYVNTTETIVQEPIPKEVTVNCKSLLDVQVCEIKNVAALYTEKEEKHMIDEETLNITDGKVVASENHSSFALVSQDQVAPLMNDVLNNDHNNTTVVEPVSADVIIDRTPNYEADVGETTKFGDIIQNQNITSDINSTDTTKDPEVKVDINNTVSNLTQISMAAVDTNGVDYVNTTETIVQEPIPKEVTLDCKSLLDAKVCEITNVAPPYIERVEKHMIDKEPKNTTDEKVVASENNSSFPLMSQDQVAPLMNDVLNYDHNNTTVVEPVSADVIIDRTQNDEADVGTTEFVALENSSSFALVSQNQVIDAIVLDPSAVRCKVAASPPSSPAIVSKGYNFNFDEIEDPFATKAKIRLSPPPAQSPNRSFELNDNRKNDLPRKNNKNDRRKSQAQPERKKSVAINKKLNNTIIGKFKTPAKSDAFPRLTVAETIESTAFQFEQKDEPTTEITESQIKDALNETVKETDTAKENTITLNKVTNECKEIPPLEQSAYFSAVTSSSEGVEFKENFSLPDFDNPDLNPFTTKSKVHQSPSREDSDMKPFTNRNKVCQTPPPAHIEDPLFTKSNIISSIETSALDIGMPSVNTTVNIENMVELDAIFQKDSAEHLGFAGNLHSSTNTIKIEKDISIKTVNTEDEDTIEGPFLEAEEFNNENKLSEFDGDMMQFSDLPTENETNTEAGEMFIDADAFEFLLNQNQTNTVVDNGKESLFLKFDPLFAKRVSSDGVLSALNRVHKKQSTPKQTERTPLRRGMTFDKSPVPGPSTSKSLEKIPLTKDATFAISGPPTPKSLEKIPLTKDATFDISEPSTPKRSERTQHSTCSTFDIPGPYKINTTHELEVHNTTDDSCDDLNVTVSKPMMIVNPAMNAVVTPRNKSLTPVRSNRQSLTFTSPAIAVIDRLLSMSSANNSFMNHDTTIADVHRDNEADLALTHLRELLADKEISVYNLRTETKDLQNRLATMESQMKNLETIGEQRLKKINELNERLDEKIKHNKGMAKVVEEYERTIASLIRETEQDKLRHAEERAQLIRERDEQAAHLASMEISFNDLHSKYEKSKQVIIGFKDNEVLYKKSMKEFEENFTKMQNNYELLKQHATSKLNNANEELQKINTAHESEVLKLKALIKRKELHITSLEETLQQKTKANEELTAICDELINKVG